jgi:hypothetical protein
MILLCLLAILAQEKSEFRTLDQGTGSGIAESACRVVRDKAAWEKLWEKHAGVPAERKRPDVDFAKETVLAVFFGQKRTGGYAIEVVKIERKDDAVLVTVRRTEPDPGSMVTMALTTPHHLVAVANGTLKGAKKVRFLNEKDSKEFASVDLK